MYGRTNIKKFRYFRASRGHYVMPRLTANSASGRAVTFSGVNVAIKKKTLKNEKIFHENKPKIENLLPNDSKLVWRACDSFWMTEWCNLPQLKLLSGDLRYFGDNLGRFHRFWLDWIADSNHYILSVPTMTQTMNCCRKKYVDTVESRAESAIIVEFGHKRENQSFVQSESSFFALIPHSMT